MNQIETRARLVVEDINGCECTGECLGESPANCAERVAKITAFGISERNRALKDAGVTREEWARVPDSTVERPVSNVEILAAEKAEQFIQAEVDRAPEALRRLGEYLTSVLDEDHWKTAERMLLAAVLAVNGVSARRDARKRKE
jgi:hypothetical protein